MAQELDELRAQLQQAQASISLLSEGITTLTAAVNNTAGSTNAAGNPLVRLEFMNLTVDSD